jgi:hypothetical protein
VGIESSIFPPAYKYPDLAKLRGGLSAAHAISGNKAKLAPTKYVVIARAAPGRIWKKPADDAFAATTIIPSRFRRPYSRFWKNLPVISAIIRLSTMPDNLNRLFGF